MIHFYLSVFPIYFTFSSILSISSEYMYGKIYKLYQKYMWKIIHLLSEFFCWILKHAYNFNKRRIKHFWTKFPCSNYSYLLQLNLQTCNISLSYTTLKSYPCILHYTSPYLLVLWPTFHFLSLAAPLIEGNS